MNDMNVNEKEALSAAIEMEKKGHKFFLDTAERAGNNMANEVFTYLAAEELSHIKAIKKFNTEYLSGGKAKAETVINSLIGERPKAAINELFKGLSDSTAAEGTNLDAYRFALDFERKGSEFYKKAESEASDPEAKKLFGFLVGEEQKHFKIVEACLLYFDNPEEFFHQQESWHMEG